MNEEFALRMNYNTDRRCAFHENAVVAQKQYIESIGWVRDMQQPYQGLYSPITMYLPLIKSQILVS